MLSGRVRVEVSPRYFRPSDVSYLLGDLTKAERKLNWKAKVGLDSLVEKMVKFDMQLAEVRR